MYIHIHVHIKVYLQKKKFWKEMHWTADSDYRVDFSEVPIISLIGKQYFTFHFINYSVIQIV